MYRIVGIHPMVPKKKNNNEQGLEQTLWQAADKLRKNIDAAEYKHIVLGSIFLKFWPGFF